MKITTREVFLLVVVLCVLAEFGYTIYKIILRHCP